LPAPARAGLATVSATETGLVFDQTPVLATSHEAGSASFNRSHQKRGPPVPLF